MRVLLDSNVWLSVITARRGFCRRLWREIAKQCEVFSGRPVVREVEEKLEKKFRYSPKRAHRLAAYVEKRTTPVLLSAQPPPMCRDPDDDLILALAAKSGCAYLITGDRDLLVLGKVGELAVVTPRQFAATIGIE